MVEASSGLEAIYFFELLNKANCNIMMMLLDINMGTHQLDGFETAAKIRSIEENYRKQNSAYRPITIVAHSGDDAKRIRQSPKFKDQIDCFATKPIKTDQMQKVLQTMISRLDGDQIQQSLIKIFNQETNRQNFKGRPRIFSVQH